MISLLLFSLSCYLFALYLHPSYIIYVVSVLLFLIAIPIHLSGKQGTRWMSYLISTFLTTVASGLSAAGYYLHMDFVLTAREVALGNLAVTVLNVILYLLFARRRNRKTSRVLGGIILGILFVFMIYQWSNVGSTYYSFLLFSQIIAVFTFLTLLLTTGNNHSVYRDISLGSFGIFLVVTFVALLFITDGDSLEFADFFDFPNSKKKHVT